MIAFGSMFFELAPSNLLNGRTGLSRERHGGNPAATQGHAADIAAGFARDAYEKYSVVAVAEQFEYVTINGERVTQDNAQERFEYWRQLHEREQRNAQPLIVVN